MNQPPTVELTSGPVEGETVSYSIDLGWEGTDPDGVIDHYEYAVDPPAAFTEEEIASGGEGISSEDIPGGATGPDVTRITKVVDGSPVSFDWVHTADTSHHFVFRTAEAESVASNNGPVPSGRFTGMHAVYVRAVDDHRAVSVPDQVAFTAETVAPESQITRPRLLGYLLTTGPEPVIGWSGNDPDGPDPVGYLTKLVRLDLLDPPVSIISVTTPDILFEQGEWIYHSAADRTLALDLGTPGQYVFGVRAVDEAGAVEPFLQFNRNAIRFQAFATFAQPVLVLTTSVGTFTFQRSSLPVETEIPVGVDLMCRVSCSAEEYGETCSDMRWGVDIADLETDEGWTPWSTDFTIDPIRFDRAGVHILYVQVRDALGGTTLGTLILSVIEFPFDRKALWVDDYYDGVYPDDAAHDAFWRARFQAYPGFADGDVDEFHAFGDNDRGSWNPTTPELMELSRYGIVVWDTKGDGYGGVTSLLKSVKKGRLALYLAAGGKLWLEGGMTIAATEPVPGHDYCNLIYPKQLEPGEFAWDFLRLHTTKLDNDKGRDLRNNLVKVRPFPGRPAIYDSMTVDSGKQSPAVAGMGIPFTDAVVDPILAHQEPGFAGVLDSLYVYAATGDEVLERPSAYQNRLVAVRWHDPDPDRTQGRIQWFGFPLYYFQDAEAQETLNRSLDWFREETP